MRLQDLNEALSAADRYGDDWRPAIEQIVRRVAALYAESPVNRNEVDLTEVGAGVFAGGCDCPERLARYLFGGEDG